MAVQVSYPGVYIEEFAPAAPIQGVSTSIAAFVGVARAGDLDEPTKLTSWEAFLATFGEQPVPGHYLWYAVRGFFENGGQTCYVVRASNGAYGEVMLQNGAGNDVIRVRARRPGDPAVPIQVAVSPRNLLPSTDTSLYQPTGASTAVAGRTLTMTDAAEAARFRPGDWLDVAGMRAQAVRVQADEILIDRDPTGAAANPGPVRLADLPAGADTVRITSTVPIPQNALGPGTMLTMDQAGTADTRVVATVQAEHLQTNPPVTTWRVTFREGLGVPMNLDPANPASVQSEEFDFTVTQGAASTAYEALGFDAAHRRYFLDEVNRADELVRLERVEPPPTAEPPVSLPADTGGNADLAGGTDEDLTTLTDQDFIDALGTLAEIDEVSLVAVPGRTSPVLQQAVISHCELLADRFGVLDSIPGARLFGTGSVESQRAAVDSARGYAALYYPWLRVLASAGGVPTLAPPSGHVCGVMARVDTSRGVHKAPANENINGAFGVEQTMSNNDQGLLNLQGVNVIRVFRAGGRPIVWGDRTTATDLNWQYINVRRLFLYLEESIQEGIRWAVFEPNNLQLWQKLRRTITEFLTRVWRDGALFGATAEAAFYVRIDETLNPFSEQRLGRLNIEVGVRPTYPAEFIIVRIGIWPGGSEVSEG